MSFHKIAKWEVTHNSAQVLKIVGTFISLGQEVIWLIMKRTASESRTFQLYLLGFVYIAWFKIWPLQTYNI